MTTTTQPGREVGERPTRPAVLGRRPTPPAGPRSRGGRPARALHPVAWWLWALGLAAAASQTTNPLLLLLVVAIAALVVTARRPEAPWAGSFRTFLLLGAAVVLLRAVFAALLSPVGGTTVLFLLPQVPLPGLFAGIRLGGPVTAENLAAGGSAGLQLAALLACVGAANSLAHPLRLLATMPAALYEVGVAVVVAVTAAPQLLVAARRVHTARRLRGRDGRGPRALAESALPVLHDALERSLLLAASMDARGYGRRAPTAPAVRRAGAAGALLGPAALLAGLVGLLEGGDPGSPGSLLRWPLLVAGVLLSGGALVLGSRRRVRTRYRPDIWSTSEWLVTACGLAAAAALVATRFSAAAGQLAPATVPLQLPPLPVLAGLGLLVAALPAVLAPPPPQAARSLPPQAARSLPPQVARSLPPQTAPVQPPQTARVQPPQAARSLPPQTAPVQPPQAPPVQPADIPPPRLR